MQITRRPGWSVSCKAASHVARTTRTMDSEIAQILEAGPAIPNEETRFDELDALAREAARPRRRGVAAQPDRKPPESGGCSCRRLGGLPHGTDLARALPPRERRGLDAGSARGGRACRP